MAHTRAERMVLGSACAPLVLNHIVLVCSSLPRLAGMYIAQSSHLAWELNCEVCFEENVEGPPSHDDGFISQDVDMLLAYMYVLESPSTTCFVGLTHTPFSHCERHVPLKSLQHIVQLISGSSIYVVSTCRLWKQHFAH